MGQECRKGAPGVRRYKGGATGEGEEKQPKQLEKKCHNGTQILPMLIKN